MNKLASILAVLVLWVSGASATTHPTFEEGEQLFVVAQSGLSLRAEPGSHQELITIIPYGEVVDTRTRLCTPSGKYQLGIRSMGPSTLRWTYRLRIRWIFISIDFAILLFRKNTI